MVFVININALVKANNKKDFGFDGLFKY